MSLASLIYEHAYTRDKQARQRWENASDSALGADSPKTRRRRAVGFTPIKSTNDGASLAASTSSQKYRPPSSASFYIQSLPGLPSTSTLTLYSGHLPSTVTSDTVLPAAQGTAGTAADTASIDGSPHLFFLLAKAKHIAEREKVLLWFNGGPGCSSFDGALMEIGPLRMVLGQKGQLEEQPGSWNEYANVVFVDQPASTGYSYVSGDHYVTSATDAATQVVNFLKNFYEVFPEYQKMDLYIGGESFAGIWIPYIAKAIKDTSIISPPLQGLLLGNPWIDPWSQYPAYVEFAYDSELIKPSTPAAAQVEAALKNCQSQMDIIGREKMPINQGTCEGILSAITGTTLQVVNGQQYCVNNYDIRLTDTYPACGMNWPNLLPDMYAWLPKKETMDAFHASAKSGGWSECGGRVSDRFWSSSKPSVHLLAPLLESGLHIMIFSGMQDLICNHVGTERMIESLQWSGSIGFSNASKALDWFVDGEKAGTWRTERNLTYVQVYNSSHMVPYDVPVVAADMFARFTSTDYISAAGASATVPSRIGSEQESVVGETHPNGTALDLAASSANAVSDSTGKESTISAESPMADAYYNVGTAMLILLVIVLLGVVFVYRQRNRRGSLNLDGSRRKTSLLPTSVSDRSLGRSSSSHRRTRSGNGRQQEYPEGGEEETNELLPLQKRQSGKRSVEHVRHELAVGEQLFAVGDDEEELDSDDEGNIGNPTRKLSLISEEGGAQVAQR